MRKPAPRNQPGAGEAKGISKHSNTTPPSLPQIAPQDRFSIFELPVENPRRRPALHSSLLEH